MMRLITLNMLRTRPKEIFQILIPLETISIISKKTSRKDKKTEKYRS